MFDPEKLSPLPWALDEWADEIVDIDYVADNLSKDDAEFFVTARRCYDIGERRGWHMAHDRFGWMVQGTNFGKQVGIRFRMRRSTQAEAMELMCEADEWLTKQETEGNSDER